MLYLHTAAREATVTTTETTPTITIGELYTSEDYPGVVLRVVGWHTYWGERAEREECIVCIGPDDDGCPDCYGDGYVTVYYDEECTSDDTALVTMVGDDPRRTHQADVSTLVPVTDPVCPCGQTGCAWHGEDA